MIRLTLAATLSTACLGLFAIGPVAAQDQALSDQVADYNAKISALRAEQDIADKRLARSVEMYKAGQTSAAQVDDSRSKIALMKANIETLQRSRRRAILQFRLTEPLTIKLDRASLQQVGTVLTTTTHVSVSVILDPSTKTAPTVTLDARAVPFSNVIEAIAEKTDLMISPADEGVELKPWPRLNDRVYRSATAPWSADWGIPPTVRGQMAPPNAGFNPFGLNAAGVTGIAASTSGLVPQSAVGPGGPPNALQATPGREAGEFGQGALPPSPSVGGPGGYSRGLPTAEVQYGLQQTPDGNGFPGQDYRPMPGGQRAPMGMPSPMGSPGMMGMPGMGAPGMMGGTGQPFTITGIGDKMFVIAEPSMSDRGEPGLRITTYQIDGSGFRRLGSGFHPFSHGPRMMGPGPGNPMAPGPGSGRFGSALPGAAPFPPAAGGRAFGVGPSISPVPPAPQNRGRVTTPSTGVPVPAVPGAPPAVGAPIPVDPSSQGLPPTPAAGSAPAVAPGGRSGQ